MDFKKICSKYNDEALKTLTEIIKINSVYDEKTVTEEKPYGEGVFKTLNLLKEIALKDGFNVDTCDNRCVEISFGEGEEYIGVFGHADVVPVSGNWKHDPFGAVIEDEKMYGRGTSDDKGPVISAYYALKALKENNLLNDFKVKLVVGGDEERGSSCLEYYFNNLKKPNPKYGFTPDGDFPLIYGEKGITNYKLEGNIDLGNILEIKAGVVSNSVIDSALVKVSDTKLIEFLKEENNIEYEAIDDYTINFIGKSAHGSLPELGINSGVIALKVLGFVYDNPVLKLLGNEYSDYNGRNMHLYFETPKLGVSTYNVGLINYKDNKFSLTINFRYPETVDSKEVINKIQEISPLPVYTLSESPCLFYDPDTTPFIQTLHKVYMEETNDLVSKPMAIGGGTYAKEAKNIVAFGSHFPNKEDHIHEANEKIDLEDFFNSMPIYARAIYELGNLK